MDGEEKQDKVHLTVTARTQHRIAYGGYHNIEGIANSLLEKVLIDSKIVENDVADDKTRQVC